MKAGVKHLVIILAMLAIGFCLAPEANAEKPCHELADKNHELCYKRARRSARATIKGKKSFKVFKHDKLLEGYSACDEAKREFLQKCVGKWKEIRSEYIKMVEFRRNQEEKCDKDCNRKLPDDATGGDWLDCVDECIENMDKKADRKELDLIKTVLQ